MASHRPSRHPSAWSPSLRALPTLGQGTSSSGPWQLQGIRKLHRLVRQIIELAEHAHALLEMGVSRRLVQVLASQVPGTFGAALTEGKGTDSFQSCYRTAPSKHAPAVPAVSKLLLLPLLQPMSGDLLLLTPFRASS